jgi:hypothetical protein
MTECSACSFAPAAVDAIYRVKVFNSGHLAIVRLPILQRMHTGSETNRAWLQCDIAPGMFKNELAVGITTAEGNVVSFFLPKDFVEDDEIAVEIVARNGEYCVVALPQRTFEGSNVARVPMNALRFA